jgi:hypothetical protein
MKTREELIQESIKKGFRKPDSFFMRLRLALGFKRPPKEEPIRPTGPYSPDDFIIQTSEDGLTIIGTHKDFKDESPWLANTPNSKKK